MEVFENPGLSIGLVWMIIHVGLMFLVAKIIKAPYFFLAVGSKANIEQVRQLWRQPFTQPLPHRGVAGRTGLCIGYLWCVYRGLLMQSAAGVY